MAGLPLPAQMETYRKRYIPQEEQTRDAAEAEQRQQLKQQQRKEAAESNPAEGAAAVAGQGEHGDGSGIKLEGIRRAIGMLPNRDQITSRTTTSELCKVFVQPATAPEGWTAEPKLIRLDAEGKDVSANKWYSRWYINEATGNQQHKQPPPETRSMCQVLAADPETARFVGRPTHFLSHGKRVIGLSACHSVCLWIYCLSFPEMVSNS